MKNRIDQTLRAFALLFIISICALFVSCATKKSTVPTPETPPSSSSGGAVAPKPTPTPVATPAPQGKYPASGWHRDYDLAMETAVTARMRSVPASRMQVICPAWVGMNDKHKNQFYSDLLYAIAKYESGYNSLAMYREVTMENDTVTGKQVISEGMLQLSYQDESWAKCGFDYSKDKMAFADDEKRLADYQKETGKQSLSSAHPERTILNPITNLVCGIKIIDFRLGIPSEPNKSQEMLTLLRGRQTGSKVVNGKTVITWAGGYWAVLRTEWAAIQKIMKSRGSQCFSSN